MAVGQALFRDSRRRRVLQDEARRSGECPPLPATEGSRYTEAANVENHPQVTQFIPRRYRSYVVGLALAGVAIALIGGLHVWSTHLADALQVGSIVAFDLAAGGGVAAWCSSLLLASLAVVAWLVYTLRRHRVDDYKARYRLWLWVGGAALLASMDSVAELHDIWASLWVSQTGWAGLDGAAWWLAPVGVVGAWMAVRLVCETLECRGACGMVLASTAAYIVAVLALVGVLPRVSGGLEPLVTSIALLIGHATGLAAVALYARYVVLDVQGLVPHSAWKDGRTCGATRADGASAAGNESKKVESDHASPVTLPLRPQNARREKEKRSSKSAAKGQQPGKEHDTAWVDGSAPERESQDDEDAPRSRKLSKSERKRLRKQRRCA